MDFLVMDVGTSGCKAAVMTQQGQVLAKAERRYELIHERRGWATLNLNLLRSHAIELLKSLSSHAAGVGAIAISSLGEAVAVLGSDGSPLFDEAITYLDGRNLTIWEGLKQRADVERVYQLTGKVMPQIGSVNQTTWYRQNEPARWAKAKRMLFIDSYIAHCLCGEDAIDLSAASASLLYDIRQNAWSDELQQTFECDASLYPRVCPMGTQVGTLLRSICEQTGLSPRIEVLVGCHDQICATLGAGAVSPGAAVLGEGSTEALNVVEDRAALDALFAAGLPIEPAWDREHYLMMSSRFSHGTCLKWFLRTFAEDLPKDKAFDVLEENCTSITGDAVFVPYLSATCYGLDGQRLAGTFLGLSDSMSRWELYRAVLEGLSCETAEMIRCAQQGGAAINALTATGGASRSAVYMQIKADILGRGIRTLTDAEAGLRGLAMTCAVHAGCYADLRQAADAFVQTQRTFEPQADASAVEKRYRRAVQAVRHYHSSLE